MKSYMLRMYFQGNKNGSWIVASPAYHLPYTHLEELQEGGLG